MRDRFEDARLSTQWSTGLASIEFHTINPERGPMTLKLTINGESHDLSDIDPETPLLWALRDHLGLVGTKYGCGIAQCGACTVWLDNEPTRACQLPVGQLAGRSVTTIEGLGVESLHPVQQAWIAHDVAQCGYCQAGHCLLYTSPSPRDVEESRMPSSA